MCEAFRYVNPAEYIPSYPRVFHSERQLAMPAWSMNFNREGTLFAVTYNTGHVEIWDYITQNAVFQVKPFEKNINTVSWSSNGRFLWFSAGLEQQYALLDVSQREVVYKSNFGEGIWSVVCSPKTHNVVLVFGVQSVVLYHYERNESVTIDVGALESEPTAAFLDTTNSSSGGSTNAATAAGEKRTKKTQRKVTCAVFDASGDFVYIGMSTGHFYVVRVLEDGNRVELASKHRFGSHDIVGIVVSARGKYLLLNCASVLRLVFTSSMTQIRDFSDRVSNVNWLLSTFSGRPVICDSDWDSQYVCAMSQSSLYVWSVESGTLELRLEKPKYDDTRWIFLSIAWHPIRPVIYALTYFTMITYVLPVKERWAAFDPRFTEIERNVVYHEREDELDLQDNVSDNRTDAEILAENGKPVLKCPDLPDPVRFDFDASIDLISREEHPSSDFMFAVPLHFTEDEISREQEQESLRAHKIGLRMKREPPPSSLDIIEGAVNWSPSKRRFLVHNTLPTLLPKFDNFK
eukprot:ANDGO_04029.mRNA.1 Retinoblastoma-binding protein 5 homolog